LSYQGLVLKVMIASPSDVSVERQIIRDVIHEWNAINSEDRGMVLMPVGWETHSPPNLGERPQEIINKQVLSGCDLLIAAFWAKLGTPTDRAPSGTAEEINEHLDGGKPALVYFSSEPVAQASIADPSQFAALKEFEHNLRAKGLVEYYESKSEFREKLSRQLAQTIIRHFPPDEKLPTTVPRTIGTVPIPRSFDAPSLSSEAADLLSEASKDEDGVITSIQFMGGAEVQTNRRNFITSNSAREVARWRAAVEELGDKGYIEDRAGKGEVYFVTNEGFRAADLLSRP
jgi:hypothetical protein